MADSFGGSTGLGHTAFAHIAHRAKTRNGRPLQADKCTLVCVLIAGLALSACATTAPTTATPIESPAVANAAMPTPSGGAFRDLAAEEKKVIVNAVAPSLRNPTAAKYHWTKLSMTPAQDGSFNYCATVDAQSPYAAYSGHQAYIIEVKLGFGGKVTSAVMGLITGGKDVAIVKGMCAKYGLDPNNAG